MWKWQEVQVLLFDPSREPKARQSVSSSKIPPSINKLLWVQAGGRCEYPGCNKLLYRDSVTKARSNCAYIAHIVADKPDGPRGDQEQSPKLAKDISNLMLLCDEHHRLIDRERIEEHSVELLRSFKKRHEDRIERVTAIDQQYQSLVVLYGANIGERTSPVTKEAALKALLENGHYPETSEPIELGLQNSMFEDGEPVFWEQEKTNLYRQFKEYVKPLLQKDKPHLSLFAIAPQPLLAYLGHLVSDLPSIDLYQRQREPDGWLWYTDGDNKLSVQKATASTANIDVALVLSLSATITPDRIRRVLGNNATIWTIEANCPSVHYLRTKTQLEEFSHVYRKVLDQIKARHGHDARIHIFPAVPHTIAVELGRCWNPKADLHLTIYDQHNGRGGFVKALEIP